MASRSDEELIKEWREFGAKQAFDINDMAAVQKILDEREKILNEMKTRGLYPQADVDTYESTTGVYPDKDDPLFLQKLLQKYEFAENKQPAVPVEEKDRLKLDPCKGSLGFELSPTQRFIGQFLNPRTPYMSALLFHGVGVGKTCSAITVAENYLEQYPKKQVIVIAPRNIQPNFSREIFSEAKLTLGEDESPNTYNGCTGNTYLKLTGTEYSRDKQYIVNRVNHMKARRYQFVGYLAFYNYLVDLLQREIGKTLTGERRAQEEYKLLRRLFSNRLIIIDEAHNVRDLSESKDDNKDAPGGKEELSESQAAKKLTPYLRMVLDASEGTKLLLLTATPMYNSYKEIIPLLNLLLINDKKAILSESDFFDTNGNFLPGGEKAFGSVLQGYVSFMRGENPLAFPVRLEPNPDDVPRLTVWPQYDPVGKEIPNKTVLSQITRLPFVKTSFTDKGLQDYTSIITELVKPSGLVLGATDGLVQAGNFLFPGPVGSSPLTRIREQGFKGCFNEIRDPRQYRYQQGISPSWLHEGKLQQYSPKSNAIVKRLRTTEGVTFIYSRFVYSGALSIALVLEANGYENAMRPSGYLKDPVLAPGGKQCALCSKKQDEHGRSSHPFRQAKYILLTGRDDLTPNNKGAIELATRTQNKNGEDVKVIIGSQVASEGIDLKFIRDLIVFDSWYHLNKLEQVIGRGIRFCSHAALPVEKRNCTVILLLTTFPTNQETVDMYQYRIGFEKASQIGAITRVMKQYAIDCNLNKDAVMIMGLDPITLEDSQRTIRTESLNDVPFTSICDWIGSCVYECGTVVNVETDPSKADISTYDKYAARWRIHQVKQRLQALFKRQPFYHYSEMRTILDDIPSTARAAILADIVGNRSFRVQVGDETGYIEYKNGFYLFQPEKIRDTGIPIALRTALFPVKQDSYEEFEEPRRTRSIVAPIAPVVPGAAPAAATAPATEEQPAEVVGNVVEFWDVMMNLVSMIKEGNLPEAKSDKKILPDSIENTLKNRYVANKKTYDKVYNSVSMLYRFYQDIKAKGEWRSILSRVAAKFLWDEVLTFEEQYRLYLAKQGEPSELLQQIWKEHIIVFDGEPIFRRVNPTTGVIEYKCGDADCSPILVGKLEEQEYKSKDQLQQLQANTNTTGNPYGTLNYKKGIFVFKTNIPVSPTADKQGRGSECANVANMVPHYNLLEDIGKLFKTYLQTDLGLTLSELKEAAAPRGVKNSVRACALTDIALRFMDELGLGGKRWFYRPLATFYTKHPGILARKTA